MKHSTKGSHANHVEKREYDWLEDPFNEEKQAEDQELMKQSGSAKIALGCLVVILLFVVIVIVGCIGIASSLNPGMTL